MHHSAEQFVKFDFTNPTFDLQDRVKRGHQTFLTKPIRIALSKRFPHAFMPHGSIKKPLMIGIHQMVMEACPELRRSQILAGIDNYEDGRTYLRSVVAGAARINLDGEPCGQFILESEAALAILRLHEIEEIYRQ